MKKAGRIIGGIVLGAAFLAAVGAGCWQYAQENKKEQETSGKNSIPIKERKIYEIGEEVKCEDLIWNIASAEFMENYDSLDSYYRDRDNLISPQELMLEKRRLFFEEEVSYLCIKGTVTNTSKYNRDCDFSGMEIFNRMEDGSFEEAIYVYDRRQDCRYFSKNNYSTNVDYVSDTYTILGEETVEFEYIIQFSEYEDEDRLYDLYLSTGALYPSNQKYKALLEEKIHLNIAPKHLTINETEPENTYEEQRDITGMKCRQWVNTDMKQYQKAGYPMSNDTDDSDDREDGEEVTEESIPFFFGSITSRLKSSQIMDWEGLSEEFSDSRALQDMAERYGREGYEKEQLKILLLDIAFVSSEEDKEDSFNFYDFSYLFTRDEAGKRWVFGTADDWIVTENSVEGGRTGHINGEWFKKDQAVTVRMAYLLTPEIYNGGELYFCGGLLDHYYKNETIQKIPLL